jgi:hypothetical protein
MKLLIILSALFLLTISAENCNQKNGDNVYKGKLQVKALCMNYTISVVGGAINPSLVEASWTDETTKKTYTNAFRLGSPCNFPESIKEGDEFYFKIDTTKPQECAVCMAYYPTPSKKIAIRVVEK